MSSRCSIPHSSEFPEGIASPCGYPAQSAGRGDRLPAIFRLLALRPCRQAACRAEFFADAGNTTMSMLYDRTSHAPIRRRSGRSFIFSSMFACVLSEGNGTLDHTDYRSYPDEHKVANEAGPAPDTRGVQAAPITPYPGINWQFSTASSFITHMPPPCSREFAAKQHPLAQPAVYPN